MTPAKSASHPAGGGKSGAPWVLAEANDKLHARTRVLKTVVKRLEDELE